jgi:beta-glucanase (GH16 family)
MKFSMKAALAASGLALVGPVLVVVASDGSGLPSASAAARQNGSTTLLPQIVQQGGKPASAQAAHVSGAVKFSPVRKNRRVVVQKRLANGPWRRHTVARQNGAGIVNFVGPAKKDARWFSYRGVAAPYGGLPKVAARPQGADVWRTAFLDQFSTFSEKWQHRPSTAESRKCSSVGDPRAATVAGGTLRLTVKRDPDRLGDACVVSLNGTKYNVGHYLNGQVGTGHIPHAFTRGVFAARIKFQRNRGQHGSFWLQPVNKQTIRGNPQASGAEIDIVEFFGRGYERGGLASFLYNYGYLDAQGSPVKVGGMAPKATRMLNSTDAWWKNYHVFSLEWTKNMYIFRVDGREHFRTKRGISGIDEYLILSLLSSDWELAQAKKLGMQPGGTMHVDWARVWQK